MLEVTTIYLPLPCSLNMDKEWINAPRVSDAYKNGCMSFIQFASHKDAQETILCPCLKCRNDKRFSTENVLHHILFNGFCPQIYYMDTSWRIIII